VVATISGGALTITVTHAATVPVTGLCTPGAERYGGQTISYLQLGDGQSATYPLAGCSDAGVRGSDAGAAGGSDGGATTSEGGVDGSITGGSAANHLGTASAASPSGCTCALGTGDVGANVMGLWLIGGTILARRRRGRRSQKHLRAWRAQDAAHARVATERHNK
jgi:hypothetical protein